MKSVQGFGRINQSLRIPRSNVPLKDIVAMTFVPCRYWQDFRSWLQPVRRLVLLLLFDPTALGLIMPGKVIFLGLAPTIHHRTAVTSWHTPLFVQALDARGLNRPRGHVRGDRLLALEAATLQSARNHARSNLKHLAGGPRFPRTLCAVPAQAIVEPAPTQTVVDIARNHKLTTQEAYANLYERLCVSPSKNPTGHLLVDTVLLSSLRPYLGFCGSVAEFFDFRPFRGRGIETPLPGKLLETPELQESSLPHVRLSTSVFASRQAKIQTFLTPFTSDRIGFSYSNPRSVLRVEPKLLGLNERAFSGAA